jgi:hypothetical protein
LTGRLAKAADADPAAAGGESLGAGVTVAFGAGAVDDGAVGDGVVVVGAEDDVVDGVGVGLSAVCPCGADWHPAKKATTTRTIRMSLARLSVPIDPPTRRRLTRRQMLAPLIGGIRTLTAAVFYLLGLLELDGLPSEGVNP